MPFISLPCLSALTDALHFESESHISISGDTGANNFYIKDSILNNCAIGPKTASNYDYAEYSFKIEK